MSWPKLSSKFYFSYLTSFTFVFFDFKIFIILKFVCHPSKPSPRDPGLILFVIDVIYQWLCEAKGPEYLELEATFRGFA